METLKVRNLIREPDSAGSGALTFEITIVDKAPPATVTLWYDLRTHLPSKRRLVYLQGDDQVRVTEVYQTWTLGTDIPDRFEHLAAKWALKAHSERVLLTQSVLALSATAIDLYRLDHNCFPARLEDLREAPPEIDRRKYPPGGYLLRILKDGWGRDLVYRVPGSSRQPYDLISLGEDGKEGGEGNALDLRNPGTLPKK